MVGKYTKTEESATVVLNLTSSIDKKLNDLSANQYTACIYKVPKKLRKANETAYTPQLVSIGPLHHGVTQLQGMEAHKLRFLNNFLRRFGIGLNTLVKFAVEKECFVRECYEGLDDKICKEQLTEMILLDGIFIVELFLENHFLQLRDTNEMVFENHWMYNDLLHDMLLLENQLPITIMNDLLALVSISFLNENIKLTIYDLAHQFFKDIGNTQKTPLTERCKARHFVEFLLILHAPVHPKEQPTAARTKFEYTRSATELHQAGVKFIRGEGNGFFDIKLTKDELSIPKLKVNDMSETFFRNLIAFEQCGYSGYFAEDIASYVILMDNFINTPYDVDLLVKSGIIENELGESEVIAHLFNNLHKEVITEANILYFDKLCEELNDYSKDKIHKWKAKCFRWWIMLKHDYFNNPWSMISVIAAFLLLILTITQTIFSILQVYIVLHLFYDSIIVI